MGVSCRSLPKMCIMLEIAGSRFFEVFTSGKHCFLARGSFGALRRANESCCFRSLKIYQKTQSCKYLQIIDTMLRKRTLKSSDPKSSESDYLSQWLLKSLGNFPEVPSKTRFFNTYFWFFNVFVHFLVEKSEWLLKSFFRTSPNRPSDYLRVHSQRCYRFSEIV